MDTFDTHVTPIYKQRDARWRQQQPLRPGATSGAILRAGLTYEVIPYVDRRGYGDGIKANACSNVHPNENV